jgi:hypothetical protein
MAEKDPGTADVPFTGALAQLAWVALEHAPRSTDLLLHAGRRWLLPFARTWLPVERRLGRTRSGEAVRLLLIGRGVQLEYLSRRTFAEAPAREALPAVGLHRLRARLGRALDQADLVVALVPRAFAAPLAGRDYLRVPALLDFILSTADPGFARAEQELRRRIRGVRASALRPRLSTDAADFERFYDDFHVPMVKERFGPLGIIQPRRVLRRRFRFGGLLWVERDGEALGADLFETRSGEVNMLVHGRRTHGDAALDSQVSLANYLFSFDHARALGCCRTNMGGCMPVLTDGLARHKRAWGATVRPRHETHLTLLIGWRSPGPAVLRFLVDNPLVAHRGAGLIGIAAVTGDQPADPRRAAWLRRSLLPEGIGRMTVLAEAGWAPAQKSRDMPPADLLQLRPALSSRDLRAALAGD